MSGFSNKPKILRGAFVEWGLTLPPLFVVFQFNPVELSRSRTQRFSAPGLSSGKGTPSSGSQETMRDFHQRFSDLSELRDAQLVTVGSESISFDIRLDATDEMNEGEVIATEFGVAPRLATLEMMTLPKDESLIGAAVSSLLGSSEGFSFTKKENPPMTLFIWGRKRVLPVNIERLNIKETEFDTTLNPIRATVGVTLSVIEGPNLASTYSKALLEVMSVLNLANITEIADVVIPG